MQIDRTTLALPRNEYHDAPMAKDLIVLHFTAGSTAAGAHRWWLQDGRLVGTAYLVERDGRIFECFPPDRWCSHIGRSEHERRSIGIEIVNMGPLRPDVTGEWLCSWPSNWTQRFCRMEERDRYVPATYRGERFFASYPGAQMSAVRDLVHHLCEQFDIPKVASADARAGRFNLGGFRQYKGVATHTNFRSDKTDVGPAFPWEAMDLR